MTTKKLSLVAASLLALSIGFHPSTSYAAWPQSVDGQQMPTLAPMLEKITAGVVSISVEGTKVSSRRVPDALRPFFGGGNQRSKPFRGLGSGVIIDASKGYIITNHHVIDDADKIKVSLIDGRQFDATLIGSDPQTDIALLQIKADRLVEVKKADSDKLRVGDFTVAIGNPFGLGQTVTSGIVSALGRSGLNVENYENFIQTDAAINSGNSGGALVNLRGELIGINTAIIAPSGGNVGIGFAIPMNMADNLVQQIIEFGEVRRGLLGIYGKRLTPELAKKFGLDTKHGAFVSQVVEDSAAEEAGIEAGDIIIKINKQKVKSFFDLRAKIGSMGAGTKVNLEIVREGKIKHFSVSLKEDKKKTLLAGEIHSSIAGATLSDQSQESAPGIVVSDVAQNSPAMLSGLRKGDMIIGIDRTSIRTIQALRTYVKNSEGASAIRVKRGNRILFLILE
ncbi:MAG: Do family serine endopeptidase [Psychrobium sp.]|nr:Do family serine endopeptidase [Psychrobium sp.]